MTSTARLQREDVKLLAMLFEFLRQLPTCARHDSLLASLLRSVRRFCEIGPHYDAFVFGKAWGGEARAGKSIVGNLVAVVRKE